MKRIQAGGVEFDQSVVRELSWRDELSQEFSDFFFFFFLLENYGFFFGRFGNLFFEDRKIIEDFLFMRIV